MLHIAQQIELALIERESMYLDDIIDIIRTHTRRGDQKVVCRMNRLSEIVVSKKMNSKRILCTDITIRRVIEGYIKLWKNTDVEYEYPKNKNIAK